MTRIRVHVRDTYPHKYLLSDWYPKHSFACILPVFKHLISLPESPERDTLAMQVLAGESPGMYCVRCGISMDEFVRYAPVGLNGLDCIPRERVVWHRVSREEVGSILLEEGGTQGDSRLDGRAQMAQALLESCGGRLGGIARFYLVGKDIFVEYDK